MTHKLKRFYSKSDDEHAHLALALRDAKERKLRIYPVYVREKGSQSKGVECRDGFDLLTELDLLWDEHPRKIYELLPYQPPKATHKKGSRK